MADKIGFDTLLLRHISLTREEFLLQQPACPEASAAAQVREPSAGMLRGFACHARDMIRRYNNADMFTHEYVAASLRYATLLISISPPMPAHHKSAQPEGVTACLPLPIIQKAIVGERNVPCPAETYIDQAMLKGHAIPLVIAYATPHRSRVVGSICCLRRMATNASKRRAGDVRAAARVLWRNPASR